MGGLLLIGFYLLYFGISFLVIIAVCKAGKTSKKKVINGFVAAFVMYNLLFWDLIPTYVMYNYYVKTKSGFWVYKTPEQWKDENTSVAETLTWNNLSPDINYPGLIRATRFNERIVWGINEIEITLLPITIKDDLIVDSKINEVLVKRTRVYGGYSGGLAFIKFWTFNRQPSFKMKEFSEIQFKYKEMGREVK